MPPKARANLDPVRRRVQAAIDKGAKARLTKGQTSVLSTASLPNRGQGYIILIKSDGTETAAGKAYREISGVSAVPDHTFDWSQHVERKGASEFVKDRAGREVRLRTLQPNGQFSYTNAGKAFFKHAHSEFIVDVPVLIV